MTARRKDGSTFPISLAVSEFVAEGRRHFSGIITDLSAFRAAEQALKDSERRLAQAQKLEAIGQLAGGIAHDLNNLLTVITGNLELMEMRLDRHPGRLADELRTFLEHSQKAADTSAQLTDRLLTFGRRRVLEPRPLVINELVITTSELLRRTLGEPVAVSTKLAPDLWLTLADVGQVESAIVNLAVNARDAMPSGGRLLIETQNVVAANHHITAGSEPGDYVLLSVSDTGSGMPREVLERAFEPFFTTKEIGRGTGLGLAMVYGFAKQSGGCRRAISISRSSSSRIRFIVWPGGISISIFRPHLGRQHSAPVSRYRRRWVRSCSRYRQGRFKGASFASRGVASLRPSPAIYAVLKIVLPPVESDKAKKIYEDMARELAFDPRSELGV